MDEYSANELLLFVCNIFLGFFCNTFQDLCEGNSILSTLKQHSCVTDIKADYSANKPQITFKKGLN